jgi:hypothetical protein
MTDPNRYRTSTISDLRAFKLTEDEWHSLSHISDFDQVRAHMDMLVLAGLAERVSIHPPEWELTDEGRAACNTIDLIFDWADFAYSEPSEATEAC